MKRKTTPLERRAEAAQQLLDEWKERPFDWKTNSHCVRLVAEHLRRMGYKPLVAKAGNFTSALQANAALKRAGLKSVGEALDKLGFVRISPAAALVGDIVELPGEAPFGALTVAMGNGRVLGFHQDAEGAMVLQPTAYVAAWRIDPR